MKQQSNSPLINYPIQTELEENTLYNQTVSTQLNILKVRLKPSLSTKILSINDFVTKLLSKLLRDFSNKVHLESISKSINKVINRQYFRRWTCF